MRFLASAAAVLVFAASGFCASMFPMVLPWDDASHNAADISHLIPPNAGSDGFVYVNSEGRLAAGGDRIKFWGNNLNFDGAFPGHGEAEKIAQRLRKFGVNLIRFHHLDMWSVWTTTNPDRELNPAQMDKLDYLIYQLKLNGIYSDINLLVARPFAYSASLGDLHPDIQQIDDWKVRAVLGFFDPQNKELQKKYAYDMLTRVNPYTGTAYINEPAVAFIEINNENGLIHAFLSGQTDNLPAYYDGLLKTQWNDWLQNKYTDHANLETAWNVINEPLGAEMLLNGDFASGAAAPWNYNSQSGVDGGVSIETGTGPDGMNAARIDVTTPGTAGWHVQFNQGGLNVTEGHPYTITFYAKADMDRTVSVDLGMDESPWENLGFSADIELTNEWQLFTFTFAPNASHTNARINFGNMGLSAASYWYTDISLKPGGISGISTEENLDTTGIENFKHSGGTPRTAEGRRDWFRFLAQTEEDYWLEMKDYVENTLGAQSVVFGTVIGCSIPNIQANFDMIDTHSYWEHPSFPGEPWSNTDWYVRNRAMANNPDASTIASLAMKSVLDKPHAVTEYNHSNPNTFVSEAMFFLSAYASFHDWDVIIPFDYNSDTLWDSGQLEGFFTMNQDPVKMASHQAAAGAFLRGDISPANDTVVIPLDRTTEIEELLTARAWQLVDGAKLGEDPKTALIHKVKLAVEGQDAPSGSLAPGTTDVSGNVFTSDTGEIVWDTSVSGRGVLVVDTPMTKFLSGFSGGRTFYLSGVTITAGAGLQNGFSSIAVSAKDSGSVEASTSLLITGLGAQHNTDAQWYEYPDTPVSFPPAEGINLTHRNQWGSAPSLVEGVEANIILPSAYENTTVYALDNTGARKTTVTVVNEGNFASFNIHPDYESLWYEVSVHHPGYTPTMTPTITPFFTATNTPTITQTPTAAVSDTLDDFENLGTDQNLWGGWWYAYTDSDDDPESTSEITISREAPGGPETINGKLRVSGTMMAGGYAGAGTNFDGGGAEIDLTEYEGISMYIKGNGGKVYVSIITGNFTDVSEHSTYQYEITTTAGWEFVDIPFSSFTQPNWVAVMDFELERSQDVQFKINDAGAFDFETDDIAFYYPEAAETAVNTPTAVFSETPAASLTPTVTLTPGKKASENLNSAYAYPSMLNIKEGQRHLYFTGLADKTILQLYNMQGELLFVFERETPAGEMAVDFGNLRRKHRQSSGIYIYVLIDGDGNKKTGKIAIVR